MLNRLVEILSDGATCHHTAQDRINLHLHVSLNIAHFVRRLITLQNSSVARDKEFGEVPLDATLLIEIGFALTEHVVHKLASLVVGVEAAKTLLCLQVSVERMLVGSVHLYLVELWKLDIEVGRAELVNLMNRTRSQ